MEAMEPESESLFQDPDAARVRHTQTQQTASPTNKTGAHSSVSLLLHRLPCTQRHPSSPNHCFAYVTYTMSATFPYLTPTHSSAHDPCPIQSMPLRRLPPRPDKVGVRSHTQISIQLAKSHPSSTSTLTNLTPQSTRAAGPPSPNRLPLLIDKREGSGGHVPGQKRVAYSVSQPSYALSCLTRGGLHPSASLWTFCLALSCLNSTMSDTCSLSSDAVMVCLPDLLADQDFNH